MNPGILILDEATSALDYESERHRAEHALDLPDRFIIAHRLSAVRHADRILVIDAGRVVEQGSHDSLLAERGLYARLHAMQAGLAKRTAKLTRRPRSRTRTARRRGTRHESTVETAFLPAALEIEQTPPSPAGRAVLWTILTVFVLAVVWASGKVDVVAVAQGRIIPIGH